MLGAQPVARRGGGEAREVGIEAVGAARMRIPLRFALPRSCSFSERPRRKFCRAVVPGKAPQIAPNSRELVRTHMNKAMASRSSSGSCVCRCAVMKTWIVSLRASSPTAHAQRVAAIYITAYDMANGVPMKHAVCAAVMRAVALWRFKRLKFIVA